MEKREYLVILYDYYKELFTDKQKYCFEDYYFNNLSLSEISENDNISRNAIHKNLKSIENKILFYESKLELYERSKKLEEICKKIDDKKIMKEIEELF